MINSIALSGFKPFNTLQIAETAPITLIYGPNSCGKSSLIQSLLLLKQTIEGQGPYSSGLITNGPYCNLGSFKSLLYKNETERELKISLNYSVSQNNHSDKLNKKYRNLPRELEIAFKNLSSNSNKDQLIPKLSEYTYRINKGDFLDMKLIIDEDLDRKGTWLEQAHHVDLYKFTDHKSIESIIDYINKNDNPMRSIIYNDLFHTDNTDKDEYDINNDISESAFMKSIRLMSHKLIPNELAFSNTTDNNKWGRYISYFLQTYNHLIQEYYDIFDRITYLGPLRSYPSRHYLITGGDKFTVGTRGEFTSNIIYSRGSKFIDKLNAYLLEFEIPYKLGISVTGNDLSGEIVVLSLLDKRTNVHVTPTDVGFGIGQLLPIIVEGTLCKDRILCVEQPEIHLHPKLQANLADFFIDSALYVSNKPKNQWIVETHSEALITRFLRRIKEGKLLASNLSVIYVLPTENGSQLLKIRIDDDGSFIQEFQGNLPLPHQLTNDFIMLRSPSS